MITTDIVNKRITITPTIAANRVIIYDCADTIIIDSINLTFPYTVIIPQGLYRFKIIGTEAKEEFCFLVDYTYACDILSKANSSVTCKEKYETVKLDYFLLKTANECNSCSCDSLCTIFQSIVNYLDLKCNNCDGCL